LLSAKPPRPLCRRSELVHDWKARLGCNVGEGVGRSQSVIVVRDDLGVLEIFANQFESKAETAHKICGLAHKWQIGDWMGPPTLRYQGLDGLDGATHSPVPRKCGWPLVCATTHGHQRGVFPGPPGTSHASWEQSVPRSMKSFGLPSEPPCSGNQVFNEAGNMTENLIPGNSKPYMRELLSGIQSLVWRSPRAS